MQTIPTYNFSTQMGWDATMRKWSSSAPDTKHSPLIGWALDGYPVFGPYSTGGAVPKDLDSCYGHTDDAYGYHYHAKVCSGQRLV